MPRETKKVRYSYTRVDTYDQCGWKYKLQYIDGHYIAADSIALTLGTLIHWIEQRISEAYIVGQEPDYELLRNDFLHCNIPKKSKFDREGGIYGVDYIKEKYTDDFYAIDKNGSSYAQRCEYYANVGIYRQKKFLEEHPDIELVDVEKYFEIMFEGQLITGYIDRVMRYKGTDHYIIDDIKTKAKPFAEQDLKTPLQFLVYAMALKSCYDLDEEPDECYYDLPLLDMRQAAGTKGWIKRGKTKMSKLFSGIGAEDWTPHPSPLCHFCNYGSTNPNQPEAGKHLCPYTSLWTRENPTFEKLNEWQGMEHHDEVMKHYLEEQCTDIDKSVPDDEMAEERKEIKKKYNFKF